MQADERNAVLRRADLKTPAFVLDVAALREDTRAARALLCDADTQLLFAMKSFSVPAGLRALAAEVDGFAASSLFEARLGRQILNPTQSLHFTTPGLRADELESLCELVDYLSFNSLPHWQRFRAQVQGRVRCGLRVNPQLSFVADSRYDPCRASSKLGVPLDALVQLLHETPEQLGGITGLHFHSNCDAADLRPLLTTVEHLLARLDPLFDQIEWINLGGGYLFNDPIHPDALAQVKVRLRTRGTYRLFMEPGAALVRRAGQLVASVVDLFSSEGRAVAVLDTSVNHMPEVFEYQFEPDVVGDSQTGEYEYLLAGSACLAGDVFGVYAFEEPLQIGARIIFPDMGAYALVKANMFNGINLPTLYVLHEHGALEAIKQFDFNDFVSLCGG
jgi:carboxynorspermidine decarboxylase